MHSIAGRAHFTSTRLRGSSYVTNKKKSLEVATGWVPIELPTNGSKKPELSSTRLSIGLNIASLNFDTLFVWCVRRSGVKLAPIQT